MKNITFVDEHDLVIGGGTRQYALQHAIIHGVVRIFLRNSVGELLIQRRAAEVMSLPSRWDQSAAGHVDEGEEYTVAAYRELKEELGISNIELRQEWKYRSTETDERLPKHRFNMIYTARYDGPVNFDVKEVSEVRWISIYELRLWMTRSPLEFTQGFILCQEEYFGRLGV